VLSCQYRGKPCASLEKRFQINGLRRSECSFGGWGRLEGPETPVFVAESRQALEAGEKYRFKSTP
jgi:hypothetical protein